MTESSEHPSPSDRPAGDAVPRTEPKSASPDNLREVKRRTVRPATVTLGIVKASDKEQGEEERQRWWLRYIVAGVVVLTLWVELGAIFTLLFFQGFKFHDFRLDDWLIGGVAGGVFLQTVWCLQNIAAHLFPEGAEKMEKLPKATLGKP